MLSTFVLFGFSGQITADVDGTDIRPVLFGCSVFTAVRCDAGALL